MNDNALDQLSILINNILTTQNADELNDVLKNVETLLFNEQYALLIEAVPLDKRIAVWLSFTAEIQRITFIQIKKETRRLLIDQLSDESCFELLAQLDFEELLEIAEALPDRFLNYAIKQLDDSQKTLYQQAQQYLDSQLGHCLDYNYVRISESLKVASAKRLITKGLNQYTEDFYAVNKQGVLTGVVAINSLLKADDTMLLREILNDDFIKLAGSSELSVAADALLLSGKMSLPVCDDKGIFIGRYTVASAYANKQIEANSKLTQSGGLNKDEDLFSSVRQSAKNRSVWLGINLITAFMASAVIGMFEVTLEQVVLLAVLMPVVASMGGISGSQTLTLIVRGLALGQITQANLKALLFKELKVGLINGLIWSVIIASITYLWFGELGISIVLGIAILGNLIAAASSGVLIPSMLNKLKIDPALSGAVLLTTVTDVVGFLVFLGLGSLFLL
ncbi:magnesium transporter [Oceanospirillaceae bacterium]|jgi:magnesium transporter|nr:magnesium transporter [Oceanospirillaceae bacterium]MDB4001717.1 magnesium transporter [Oceanospirillaceae bacterium]MDB9752852.1 magnesium transporter [Oceanospirillaceae bacterium]MDB9957620.1 magnesium transporter [Oceanospirillaceae bacterium]MDC1341498.1 magnesium transporter [Oceanospirillaceae bacterium]|tara:strand:+ start:3551 stop:4903 length:1353 start_codon:yes stop_codon:yes gene_type:complete